MRLLASCIPPRASMASDDFDCSSAACWLKDVSIAWNSSWSSIRNRLRRFSKIALIRFALRSCCLFDPVDWKRFDEKFLECENFRKCFFLGAEENSKRLIKRDGWLIVECNELLITFAPVWSLLSNKLDASSLVLTISTSASKVYENKRTRLKYIFLREIASWMSEEKYDRSEFSLWLEGIYVWLWIFLLRTF